VTPFGAGVRAIAVYNMLRYLHVRIEGLEHLPRRGPAIVAARHYHHLYDGAVLVHGLPRQPHVFVALDWTRSFWERLLMETVCDLADWPVALRGENLDDTGASAFSKAERDRYVRRSVGKAAELLRRGEVLVIFPEGYPTIDPVRSRKRDDEILPFARGLTAIVALAERGAGSRIPIVPAGFLYSPRGAERYDVVLRLGEPVFLADAPSRANFLEDLRTRVQTLSA